MSKVDDLNIILINLRTPTLVTFHNTFQNLNTDHFHIETTFKIGGTNNDRGITAKNGARGSPNCQSGSLLCPPIPNLEVLDDST